MRYLNKAALVVMAIVGSIVLSACATGPSPVYRTYYLDGNCNYYYTDMFGNKVVDGQYGHNRLMGLQLHQDGMGRWYYEDALGNRVYQSKRCG